MNHYESLDDDTGALITLIGTEKGATMTICTDLGCVLHPQVVDVPFRVHGPHRDPETNCMGIRGYFHDFCCNIKSTVPGLAAFAIWDLLQVQIHQVILSWVYCW